MDKPQIIEASVKSVTIGQDVKIMMPSNLYNCFLGDNVFIGPFVEIQRGVQVGNRSRIQSHSLICELVVLGEDCFIGHGVVFINDPFDEEGPARGDKNKWKCTQVGNRVSIGSNATILPVSICDDVVIGAGSVVTKSITEPGIYFGNPAKRQK